MTERAPSHSRHVCSIGNSQERAAIVGAFMADGLQADERLFCVLDDRCLAEVAHYLRERDQNIEFLLISGQIVVLSHHGDWVEQVRGELETAHEGDEQSRLRVCIQHGTGDGATRKQFSQLEQQLEDLSAVFGIRLLCYYNRDCHNARLLLDVLGRHSFVYSESRENPNPYYLPQRNSREKLEAALKNLESFQSNSDQSIAEAALRESEERYALAAQGANDGLWDWNLKTASVHYSSRWRSMLGLRGSIQDSIEEWYGRIHSEDLVRVQAEILAHLRDATPHFESEYRMLHQDGCYRWVLSRGLAVRDAEGNPTRMAGSQTDITQRKKAEEQLQHEALHDTLTGLPNRPLFMDRLNASMNRARRRNPYLFAVLFLDVDRFKLVNDSLGHHAGDEVLREVARKLQSCLRPDDTVARLGGDEFAILLDEIRDVTDAIQVSKRIQETMAVPFVIDGQEIYTALSIGIAVSKPQYKKPEDVLRDADTAMYRAKALGNNRHQFFATGMHQESVAMLHLENSLRRAIDHREFALYYMPIVSMESGDLSGFEALIRWQDPVRGILTPDVFIRKLEETGLIEPVGEWVLRQACLQLQIWQAERNTPDCPMKMSVNLSMKQFSNPDIVNTVRHILEETGIPPQSLILEITESTIMENPDQTTVTLMRLRDLGVELHIDDFGTGYSSLSYLMRFPLNALKIDRSFVCAVRDQNDSVEMLRTIVSLARNLGLEIIAEGAETPYQLEVLKDLGCDYAQGYFFCPPVDAEKAGELIRLSRDPNAPLFSPLRRPA